MTTYSDRVRSLAQFTALEHLRLAFARQPESWERVASMLQSIPSSRVRSVTVEKLQTRRTDEAEREMRLDLPSKALFDQAELGMLDPILTEEPFGNLGKVVIHVKANKEDREELLEAYAQRHLPKLYERKLLRLCIS